MIKSLGDIFSVMPKFTILSTATAPNRESIPMLEQIFLSKYPAASVEFIKSTKIRIASEISDLEGNIFIPHANCTTLLQFEHVISKIKSDCFLQKCYAPNVVNEMFGKLKELCQRTGNVIPVEVDFNNYLNQTCNMNQDAICKLAIRYLELLADIAKTNKSNAIIAEFCSSRYTKQGVDFASLAKKAHQFESQTLIVTKSPTEFLSNHFSGYLDAVMCKISKKRGFEEITSFNEMYAAYNIAHQLYMKEKETIENDVSKSSNRDADGVDYEVQRRTRIADLEKPILPIPSRYVIGSTEYMSERKSKSTLKNFIPENISWNSIECDDSHKLALCLGIGLYSRSYHSSYTSLVLQMASNGQLAYLIADDAICYGTNYPIENVIVDETCLTPESHSVKTVFQVFARAGRPGKSWRANIFAAPSVLTMIEEYIHNSNFRDIEVQNMNKALYMSFLNKVFDSVVCRSKEAIDTHKKMLEKARHFEWEAQQEAMVKVRKEAELKAQQEAELKALEESRKAAPKAYVPPHLRKSAVANQAESSFPKKTFSFRK
jgi:hypothetical protein